MRCVIGCLSLLLSLNAVPSTAQDSIPDTSQLNQQVTNRPSSTGDQGRVISAILTIDSDRVFWESDYGIRVRAEIAKMQNDLSAENIQIRDALAAEEKDLTAQRPLLEPTDFRTLADAFDQKVQETSTAQNAKGQSIQEFPDQERVTFLNLAAPIFERLMREAGSAVILERRYVFVSASAIEITDAAIAALNDSIGDGVPAD